jgi:sulfonate transport system substrate-binding protein
MMIRTHFPAPASGGGARNGRPSRSPVPWKRLLLSAVAVASVVIQLAPPVGAQQKPPAEIRIDYASYNPVSLVLKQKGWLEGEFKGDGAKITWLYSAGSNKAVEYISTGAGDFTSSAGAAALLARANKVPLTGVYIYSKPEWTALVVRKDSPIKSIADLRGKKIAATKGTDPYIFLLRALHTVGLTKNDVQIFNLQHPDGRIALERGDVDAWAGLDPHMAATELDQGSRLIYRNPEFNTYGFLNVRDDFARRYPGTVHRVLRAYERARRWVIANSADTVQILATEAKISLDVARQELKRNEFSNPVPGEEHVKALTAASEILVAEQLAAPGADVPAAVKQVVDGHFAKAVVGK